jgi:hypothetical protein
VCQRFGKAAGDSWEIRGVEAEYWVYLNGERVATATMPDFAYDILDAHTTPPGIDMEASLGR